MNLNEAIILFGIMVSLAALPSSSVALVVARSATSGLPNGIAVTIGIVFGDLIFLALAILGLSVVAEALGSFFVLIKVLGGVYLIFLGIKLLGAKANSLSEPIHTNRSKGLVVSFVAGFLLTLGDVKAILFYASLLPMFVDLSAVNAQDIIAIVASTGIAVGGVKVAYAVFGAGIFRTPGNQKFAAVCQKTAGSLLVGTGSYMALKA